MIYLIIGAALLAVLFVSIEARLRGARARDAARRRSHGAPRPDPHRLRRGRADLRLVRPAPEERRRSAHG